MDNAAGEGATLAEVRRRIEREFAMLDPAIVGEVVDETWRNFDGCRIRVYLPILVERAASARLHALAALFPEEVPGDAVRVGNA